MHVVCLYLHYATPDCASGARAYSLLRAMGRRHRVTLLTGTHYRKARLSNHFPWAPPGVTVREVDLPYRNRMSARQRLRAYLGFPAWAVKTGLFPPVAPDLVYGISTPLTTAAAAASLAWVHGIPWILEVRDLWPDVPIQMGAVRSSLLRQSLYALEHSLYHSAASVITVSPDMCRHVRHCGVPRARVNMFLQGTDLDLHARTKDVGVSQLREAHGIGERTVVLYAGALGRANAILTLLDTAQQLAHHRDLVFVFAGNGYYAADVEEAAHRLPNVVRLPPQPRHRMMPWFRLAAVSLVSFGDAPVLGTNAPTKLFDSLAAGTPVVVTNPGWMTSYVRKHQCGWSVPPEDSKTLSRRLLSLLRQPDALERAGRQGAALAPSFDRAVQAEHIVDLCESLVRDPSCPLPPPLY